jgi:hypothetical protein
LLLDHPSIEVVAINAGFSLAGHARLGTVKWRCACARCVAPRPTAPGRAV